MSLDELRVVLIADDLTGACDAAVAFADCGMRARVLLDWREFCGAVEGVVATSTESRDVDEAEVESRLGLVVERLRAPSGARGVHWFKKIDSVFRGNTVVEIRAAVREFAAGLTIVAPAYPAAGRISVDGVLRVRDLAGEWSLPVVEDLIRAGVAVRRIEAGLDQVGLVAEMKRGGVVYCDATSEGDLEAIVCAGLTVEMPVLWVGSAGLAHALAGRLKVGHTVGEQVRLGRGRVVFFVGSDHPVTLAQMACLRESGKEVLVVPVVRGVDADGAIVTALAGLAAGEVGCLFMTGGDTAMLVCRALGITALELRHEFEPGLACGVAEGGRMDGVTVILKSGGFGRVDVLCRIAEQFSS